MTTWQELETENAELEALNTDLLAQLKATTAKLRIMESREAYRVHSTEEDRLRYELKNAEAQLAAQDAIVQAARLAIAEFRGEPVDELWLAVRLTRLGRALDALPQP